MKRTPTDIEQRIAAEWLAYPTGALATRYGLRRITVYRIGRRLGLPIKRRGRPRLNRPPRPRIQGLRCLSPMRQRWFKARWPAYSRATFAELLGVSLPRVSQIARALNCPSKQCGTLNCTQHQQPWQRAS